MGHDTKQISWWLHRFSNNMLSPECWYLRGIPEDCTHVVQCDNLKSQLCHLFAVCTAGIMFEIGQLFFSCKY
jgi:hypothetical protein